MKIRAKTKEQAARLTYGPTYRPVPYQPGHCCAQVWHQVPVGLFQCTRRDGHGIHGTLCKQHAAKEVPA